MTARPASPLPRYFPLLALAVTLALAVYAGSGCGDKPAEKRSDGVIVGKLSQVKFEAPAFDPKAPLPSPGVSALAELARIEPGVAGLSADVEATERAALKAGIAKLPKALVQPSEPGGKDGAGKTTRLVPVPGSGSESPALASSTSADASDSSGFSWIRSAYAADGGASASLSDSGSAAVLMGVVVGLGDIFIKNLESGAALDKSASETKDGTTSTMSIDLGKKADGSSNFGLGMKSESSKDGVKADVDFQGKIEGRRCPDAEGKVDFTAKLRIAAGSGENIYARDLTTHVTGTVDDNAQLVSSQYDLLQGTRKVADGKRLYLESSLTVKVTGTDYAGGQASNLKAIHYSGAMNMTNAGPMAESGHQAALAIGYAAMGASIQNWRTGGCTKIIADSPGKVDPASVTKIPVKVTHRFDGSDVPSKLEVKLSGDKSVDPTLIPKTAGTLSYTAPDKKGRASMMLTATSKRGIATLELNATTGGNAYTASGGKDEAVFSGVICDLEKPFELDISGGASGKFKFIPSGDNPLSGGSSSYKGTYAMGSIYGSGTYSIKGDPVTGKGLKLVEVGEGCATTPMGPTCADESEEITLTPADGESCPQ